MNFSPDNFESEFEDAIRMLTGAMPEAKELSKPTLLHNIRVGINLYTHGYAREVCLAGLLHDAVEDTSLTEKDIEDRFGIRVSTLVRANTKDEQLKGKMEKYHDLMRRCIEIGEDGAIIKAADIIDNYLYFSKIGDEEKAQWMIVTGRMLLEQLPAQYKDPLFEELRIITNINKFQENAT